MVKLKFPKIKFPKIKVIVGLSLHQRNKIKKAIKYKEDELKSIEYTLSSGFGKIDLQINEMKEKGFNEENIRAVLSKDLTRMLEYKSTLEIEVQNLEKYLFDDKAKKELSKAEKEEIKRL